jgi:hypothetical protein
LGGESLLAGPPARFSAKQATYAFLTLQQWQFTFEEEKVFFSIKWATY